MSQAALTPFVMTPFVITREFRAPRALLWQVQTQAEHMQHWLSPEGFHTIHADMDFRVGGRYHYGLEGPNGLHAGFTGTFAKLDAYLLTLQG